MILIKSAEEIELIRENSVIVSKVLAEVGKMVKPGVTTLALDKMAEDYILSHGAKPAFKGYKRYPATLCTSVNSEVVHGIPSGYVLKEGDIVSVDCGVVKNGYYGDSAFTFAVGQIDNDVRKLLLTTRESLFEGIGQAVVGKRIGDIGFAIQKHCEANGYSVVREMVGHGMGKNLHEEPEVPNYGKKGTGPMLKKGMVLCIEPMINMGKKNIRQENDGWTIKTTDDKPSAHYELTVVVGADKADILSTFEYIDEPLYNLNQEVWQNNHL